LPGTTDRDFLLQNQNFTGSGIQPGLMQNINYITSSPLQNVNLGGGQQPSMLQGMNWQPPQRAPIVIEFASSLNIDGQKLADVVQKKIADMMEFPNSAPFHNGRSGYSPNDMGTLST
jgi:hypothetical protein